LDEGVTLTISPNICVRIGIGLRHFVPAVFQTQAARLRLEIGELPAGHFVQVNLGCGRGQAGFEGGVMGPHRFPVVRDPADLGDIQAGVAISVPERLDKSPRQGCEVPPEKASIAASTASTPASQAASTVAPAMPLVSWVWKWIGRPTSCFSALDKDAGRGGFQQPRHVLQPQHMRTGGLQFLAHADIIARSYFDRAGSSRSPV
jgi:hypothetical protein